MLDGDAMRNTISKDLGFTIEDREENIRRIACIANIINKAGQDVIVSTISPTKKIRNLAKEICGEAFKLIFVVIYWGIYQELSLFKELTRYPFYLAACTYYIYMQIVVPCTCVLYVL